MLAKTAILLASFSAVCLGVAVAAPLAQPERLSARDYIDNPRFRSRNPAVIARGDDTDSVRITGDGTDDTHWGKRDDPDSVRITGDTPWGRRARSESGDDGDGFVPIKGRDDGLDKEMDWGR